MLQTKPCALKSEVTCYIYCIINSNRQYIKHGPDSLTKYNQSTDIKAELQIIFHSKEYSPSDFEIKGYFCFQKEPRGYLVNWSFNFCNLLKKHWTNVTTKWTEFVPICSLLIFETCFFFSARFPIQYKGADTISTCIVLVSQAEYPRHIHVYIVTVNRLWLLLHQALDI
jgi:hypothetical protein